MAETLAESGRGIKEPSARGTIDPAADPGERGRVLAAAVLFFGLTATPASALVLSAGEPEPMALLVVTPTGEPGRVSRSEAIRAIEEALEAETNLTPVLLDPVVNEDCRGKLSCIASELRREERTPADWLLVVTQITLEGDLDRVFATLVHLESLPMPATEDAVDRARTDTRPEQVGSVSGLRSLIVSSLRGPLRSPLEAMGDLRDEGSIFLAGVPPGALIHVDDRPLGVSDGREIRIEGVAPGRHQLRLTLSDRTPWQTEVEIGRGSGPVQLRAELPSPLASGDPLRTSLAIGGTTLAVAGTALMLFAITRTDGDVKTACFSSRPGCEPGTGFTGFGYDPEAGAPRAVDPDGIGVGPLGAAIATTGLGWALGALLEPGEVPWWSMGLSLLAGGAVLGASLAIDAGALP